MWYDGSAGLGRLDYWGGVDRYIYNSSGIGYQIVPTTSDGLKSDETCFTTGESGEVDNLIFPDLTYFPEEPDESTTVIDGETGMGTKRDMQNTKNIQEFKRSTQHKPQKNCPNSNFAS